METRPKVVAKTTMFASIMIERSKIKLSNIKSVTVTVRTVTLKTVEFRGKIIYVIFHNSIRKFKDELSCTSEHS